MTRVIRGLVSASMCKRPSCIPKSRPRGKKAAGVKYEKDLAKALPLAKHGQWFQFEDAQGTGYCQTDLLLNTARGTAVLEAKYTWTPQGHFQLEKLYIPVVSKAMGRPAIGLVVCKVLTRELDMSWLCRDLEEAVERCALGVPTVLHWIGSGLGPLRSRVLMSHLASGAATL